MSQISFSLADDPQKIRQSYLDNGVVVIRNVIDEGRLTHMRELARKVVYARAKTAGIELAEGLDLDEAFNRMCAVNRAFGGDVYGCLRHHPDAVQLSMDPSMLNHIENLLGTKDVYPAIDQIHFRIDRKNEAKFSLPWHQDYWWNNTSQNALTVWYSLVDVPMELGPMRFLLGSHRNVAKIKIDPNYKVKWDQNKLFKLAEDVDDSKGVDIPVNAGDVVFLHALAMHRSGVNLSEKNRWTVVTRYVPMFEPDFVAKGWKSGIRVGYTSLVETHPECIVNLNEVVEPA